MDRLGLEFISTLGMHPVDAVVLAAELGVRRIELRGYAFGGGIDSRKVALARALVVRAYLIDARVKARIEVGSFEGEGSHVEILAPRS